MPKVGDVVRIYEDPLTEKTLEGEAKLIELLSEDTDREYWLVEFTRGHERHPRWIKKESEHGYPPREPERTQSLCGRLQYFIDEEEKGINEYEWWIQQAGMTQKPSEDLKHVITQVWRIVQEQRNHVEILKRIKERLCPG